MARKKGVPNVRNNGSRSRGGEESPPPVDLQLAPAQFPPQQQLAPPPPSAFAPQPVHTYYATPAPLPPPPVAPVYQRGAPRPVALPDLNDRGPRLPPGLDLFAEIYQPLWLRNVNDGPFAHYFQRSPAEATWIVYESHINALFPVPFARKLALLEDYHRKSLVKKLIAVQPPPPLFQQPQPPSSRIIPQRPGAPPTSAISPPQLPSLTHPIPFSLERQLRTHLPGLSPSTYAEFWVPLQTVEYAAIDKQLRHARLFKAPLSRLPPLPPTPASPTPPILYVLQAPSIREGWPNVDLCDVLEIRQLRPEQQAWQGLVFEATVWGVNRAKGEVILRCDALRGYEETLIFNVSWKVQDRIFLHWRRATETLDHAMNPTVAGMQKDKSITETWLFPTPEDIHEEPEELGDDKWPSFDPSLNTEQQNAVKSILWGKHTVPFLISGPPGTGKTKTLVEAVLQLLKKHPTTHILVCGASGPSADTLAMRLRRELSPNELFRLNAPSRPFTEVRDELLPYCYSEGDRFTLPPAEILLSKRVICCTVLDASLLLATRCSNHDLSSLQLHILHTIHPQTPIPLTKPHFGFLLIDEAAQATEPDLACALSIVTTDHGICSPAHVTICGDSRQLGPVIVSQEARGLGLDVSLLERLAEREVYSGHPCARRNKRRYPDAKWTLGTPFVDLTKNYRSATPILMLPSTLFYNETLEPFAPATVHTSPLHTWSGLPNQSWPILFKGVAGEDLPIDEGASFYNEQEVQLVTSYILGLVGSNTPHGTLLAREVSVISPFREQVWRIRLALRAVGLHDVDVGSVEALQGAENRVVIISAVRSTGIRWLPQDRAQSRGLIHEPKRFNVAMTRAKELLIVIGNPNTLTIDPYWQAFYNFCLRNGCYSGPTLARPQPLHHSTSSHSTTTSTMTQTAVSNGSSTTLHSGTPGSPNGTEEDEEELDGRFATAGVEAVSRLEMEWHATRGGGRDGRTNKQREKSDFDILVGRMVGVTFEEE